MSPALSSCSKLVFDIPSLFSCLFLQMLSTHGHLFLKHTMHITIIKVTHKKMDPSVKLGSLSFAMVESNELTRVRAFYNFMTFYKTSTTCITNARVEVHIVTIRCCELFLFVSYWITLIFSTIFRR